MLNKFSLFLLFTVSLLLASCATRSVVAQKLDLGMTTNEVSKNVGKPFSRNVYRDDTGNVIEEWLYREQTWDDGGMWTDDRTIVNTIVIFEDNKVKSFTNDGGTKVTHQNIKVDAKVKVN